MTPRQAAILDGFCDATGVAAPLAATIALVCFVVTGMVAFLAVALVNTVVTLVAFERAFAAVRESFQ